MPRTLTMNERQERWRLSMESRERNYRAKHTTPDGLITGRIPGKLFVYFFKCGEYVKIGQSESPRDRLTTLAYGVPYDCELLLVMRCTKGAETALHKRFSAHRHRGEWFRLDPEIVQFIGHLKQYCVATKYNYKPLPRRRKFGGGTAIKVEPNDCEASEFVTQEQENNTERERALKELLDKVCNPLHPDWMPYADLSSAIATSAATTLSLQSAGAHGT